LFITLIGISMYCFEENFGSGGKSYFIYSTAIYIYIIVRFCIQEVSVLSVIHDSAVLYGLFIYFVYILNYKFIKSGSG